MDILFDPELVVARRRRAARDFDPHAGFLMDLAGEELAFRLAAVERHFEQAAELFGGTGSAASAARRTGKIGALKRIDVAGQPDTEATSLEDVPLEPA